MRWASAMMMAVAMVAAGAGGGAEPPVPVRGQSAGPPPTRPRSLPSMRGCWNPAGGIAAARRNRLKGRKGRRR